MEILFILLLLANTPNSSDMEAACELFADREFSGARDALDRVLSDDAASAKVVQNAECLRARVDLETEDFESFEKRAKRFIDKYPATGDAEFLKFHVALLDYREGDWNDAVTSFDRFVEQNADSSFVARARLLKCRSLFNAERYADFLTAAEELLSAHPDTEDAAFVVYHQAYSAWKLEDSATAIEHASEVIKLYPETEFACTVRMVLAEVHLGDARAHRMSGNFEEEKTSTSKALKALDEFRDEAKQLKRRDNVDQEFKERLDNDILHSWRLQTD